MALNPTVDALLIACLPALAVLLIAVIAGSIWSGSTYRRALAQSRLEIDLLRRSLGAEQERQEESRNRLQGELNQFRSEAQDRLRALNAQLEGAGERSEKAAAAHPSAAAFDFRPSAFETLWTKVLKIREFALPILAIYDLPSATDFLPVDERLRHVLPRNADEDFRHDAEELRSGAEALRPFLGEDIWQIYSVYYAYAVRSAWKVIAGKVRGHIPPWDRDFEGNDDIRAMLFLVLSADELATAIGDSPSGAPGRILTALECMMLDAMNVWMFGAPLSHLGLRDREKIAGQVVPELDLTLPAARHGAVAMLGGLRLSQPKFRKSINPRLRAH